MKGLVIKQPWIDFILKGEKTWELRSTGAKIRGRIALIQSKSGKIIGTCEIVDCVGPLSNEDLEKTISKHCVPKEAIAEIAYTNTYAWVLAKPKRLQEPVPYKHPSGAVIWVELNPSNCPGLSQIESSNE